jgi:hypothetical protein
LFAGRAVECIVVEHLVEQQVDRTRSSRRKLGTERTCELALRVHVEREHTTTAVQREVGRQVGHECGLGAATFFVDERDPARHSTTPPVVARCAAYTAPRKPLSAATHPSPHMLTHAGAGSNEKAS